MLRDEILTNEIKRLKRRVGDLETIETATIKNPFVAVPLAISTVLTWPNLKVFIPPGPLYKDGSSNWYFTNLADPTEYFTQSSSPRPVQRLFNGYRPQVSFTSSAYAYNTDKNNWDINGGETNLHADWRGLTIGAWTWFNSSASAIEYILSKRYGSTQASYSLSRLSTGEIRFVVSNTGTTEVLVDSTDTVGASSWQFVCGRFDPSTGLYLRVNDETYSNTTSVPATIYLGAADLYIAARDDASTPPLYPMAGTLSMMFVCGAYLPDETISGFYNLTKNIYDTLWTP